jgi:hypothetical protein
MILKAGHERPVDGFVLPKQTAAGIVAPLSQPLVSQEIQFLRVLF